MRLKPVPAPPEDLAGLATARRAVPLVPGSEDDCCARLQGRLDLVSRREARTWLTFLRALELAEETATGFARTRLADDDGDDAGRDLPPRSELAASFEANVFAAREVLDALVDADEPLDADETFRRVEEVVPGWERHKDAAWRDAWRDRVARLLGWAELFGLAERVASGFEPGDDVET